MLLRLLTQFGYLAITGSLVAGGMGFPVPEELVQLTAGYLSRDGTLSFWPALVAAYLGIVIGDSLFFHVAQRQGNKLLERPAVARVLTPARRAFLDRHFERHAVLTIVVARHTSGLRLAAYALAACHGMKARTFILADAFSALLSVPLVVSLGYLFAEHLEEVKKRVHEAELLVLVVVVLVGVAVVLVKWRRNRPPTGSAAPSPPP
ncbi:MAG TPA: DedA family protein [Anaeromyxobacteraceae bacterium]